MDDFREWIGSTERRMDEVASNRLVALSATLDRDDPEPQAGTDVPPLWHWLFFTPTTKASEIGEDGHAKKGGFLPPVPLPRRMWAGGRFQFNYPLQVGQKIERVSRIADVSVKEGRSGPLVFVCVKHEVHNDRGIALVEEHDIVYREKPRSGQEAKPQPAPTGEDFTRQIVPDPVLLFRYSALTFNGHRIHYDRSYVTAVEGYPGLIVHGPLIATLLLDLVRRNMPKAVVKSFSFKAMRPVFDIHKFTVCGRRDGNAALALWARDCDGYLAMEAQAQFND